MAFFPLPAAAVFRLPLRSFAVRSGGGGDGVAVVFAARARTAARNADASIESVTWRNQPTQERTSY